MTFEEWWAWYSGGTGTVAERLIAYSAWKAGMRYKPDTPPLLRGF